MVPRHPAARYRQHSYTASSSSRRLPAIKAYLAFKKWLELRLIKIADLAAQQAAAAAASSWMRKLWHLQDDSGGSIELQSLVGRSADRPGRPRLSVPSPAAAYAADGSGYKNKKGVMHARAATKFQQLSISYKSREELQRQENVELPQWVLHPHEFFAQCWWTFISCTVMVALFVDPFSLAFAQYPGLYPPAAPDTIFTVICTLLYACDVLLNFIVAYYEEGVLVIDLRRIAAHYASTHLWADLVTTIPFDLIILQLSGLQQSDSVTAWCISLLRLLRMGRVYRLYSWVQLMTYNQTFSLLAVTLARNFALCFYTVHVGACGFWYIAKQNGFSSASWVGANMTWVGQGTAADKWWWSMYWSIITFSTVGYGDLHAYNVTEAIFVVLYMFVSIGVAAYFVGTSVLLVVENEKKTGAYRESLMVLDEYSSTHEIPQALKADMKGHLQLHFSSADLSDEAVLAVYPTTIRQRILRHLYSSSLASCWLFTSCQQQFLDALLASAQVELYMPQVDIVTAGDQVNELHVIVAGQAAVERVSSADVIASGLLLVVGGADDGAGAGGGAGGRPVLLGAGGPAGEAAFFTEMHCMESVRTTGLCRVLTISRSAYNAVASDFPTSSSVVLDNLVARAEEMIRAEFKGPAAARIMCDLDSLHAPADLLGLHGATGSDPRQPQPSPLLHNTSGPGSSMQNSVPGSSRAGHSTSDHGSTHSTVPPVRQYGSRLAELQQYLSSGQQQVVSNLLRVRALVKASRARLDQQRTHEFLHACSSGNLGHMRTMLQQGCSVGCCDYDGRSGLVLASSKGHSLAVKLLLLSGADVHAQDRLGNNALLEAVKAGHDEVIDLLQVAGAKLPMRGAQAAALLCSAVSVGDLALLRRLLHAGAHPNTGDYDGRTALHIAAADCNLPVVKLLVEVGSADPCLQDRWQQTALEEAGRAGAAPVVAYLASKVPAAEAARSRLRAQHSQVSALLDSARQGECGAVRQQLERGCPVDAADAEGRTALMVAAAHGHLDAVSQLLASGANPNACDSLAGCPLLAAVRRCHLGVVSHLVAAGAKLQLPAADVASALCNAVACGDEALLRCFMAAGVDASAVDHCGQTPLHVAAAHDKLEMVKLLIEQGGADVAAADRWGHTPMDEAQHAAAASVLEYLSSRPAASVKGVL